MSRFLKLTENFPNLSYFDKEKNTVCLSFTRRKYDCIQNRERSVCCAYIQMWTCVGWLSVYRVSQRRGNAANRYFSYIRKIFFETLWDRKEQQHLRVDGLLVNKFDIFFFGIKYFMCKFWVWSESRRGWKWETILG